jgi:hypothetical protein
LIRGEVLIVEISRGPLRWPIGEKDGERELIVYSALAQAVSCETPEAIAAEWGVPVKTVVDWQRALHPGAVDRFKPEPSASTDSFSLADWWAVPSPHQYSLLDLMFWMFWVAVLSALLRLMYGHTQISDKWHVATTCCVASLSLAAAWGYGKKIPAEAGQVFRAVVIFASLVVGLLLVFRIVDVSFTALELIAIVLGVAAVYPVGLYIGSR